MIKKNQSKRVLSVFVLAMLNVSIMASLRSLPLVAEYALSAVFYFALVAIFFLVPSSLISAELATGWPKSGGVYVWVREALGDRWGFFSIWMQWVHNVAWYPVILSFIAITLSYVIDPKLIHNKFYVISVVLILFWGMTFLNCLGIKTSSWFSTIGVIVGTIAPGLLIIGFGITWLIQGHPSQIEFSTKALLPDLSNFGNLAFLTGLFLAFGGMEVSAAHAAEVKDPQKNYPRSILLAAIITFVIFMLGSLSIAIVIPKHEISLVAGIMEAFDKFFSFWGLKKILPLMAVLMIIGAVAEINSWIIGPVKGLYSTSIHGNLPPFFQKHNSNEVPVNLLYMQAILVTAVSCVFLFMPSISAAFWILSALSAQSYLLMYICMFISAIVLRYKKPHVPRTYRIPHQNKGMWLFASMGALASFAAILIAFIPPSQIAVGSLLFYDLFLITGLTIMAVIPLLIHQKRKPEWFLAKKNP